MSELRLTDADEAKLRGDHGSAVKMAMSIMVRMAPAYGATELMDISAAHIDSTVFMGDATLEFAERLADLGAKVVVPSTLNVSGVDEFGWQEWEVPPDWARKAQRQMQAYESMGCIPTWTCAPYQTEHCPSFGDQIASGESNAIAYYNSVVGARTERYPDLLDICAAITGRVPKAGLHLTENRFGDIVLDVSDAPDLLQQDDSFFPVLGHLLGRLSPDRIPVVDGLRFGPTSDQFKAMGAGASSSGAVAMFHVVGFAPESPTLEAALRPGSEPERVHVTMDILRNARDELSTAIGDDLQMIVLGSPHYSLAEFARLAPLVAGKERHPDVKFLVTTSRMVRDIAEKQGVLEPLLRFGGMITVDTCPLTTPMFGTTVKTLMTNSAKYAYYSPGLLNVAVVYGSTEDCVDSAVRKSVVRDDTLWTSESPVNSN